MLKNKNKGITLIALVITIIILLILAGITISTLTNQGLFKNAKEAQNATEKAESEQGQRLNEYEDEINKYLTNSDKAEEKLVDKVNDGTIKIGDYVKYTPDTASTTEILQELNTYSGSSNNSTSTLTQENLNWRVLDVKDGQVRLISELPTTSTITLSGYNGYNNAVKLLNDTCNTLYTNSKLASKVSNLNIEDVTDKMIDTNYSNITSEYGKTFITTDKYYPDILLKEKEQKIDETVGTELEQSEQKELINQSTKLQANALELKGTYWAKSMKEEDFHNSKYYELFINNGSNYSLYWTSSRCILNYLNHAHFRVHVIYSDSIDAMGLYYSSNDVDTITCAFRPIVTLNSNVLIDTEKLADGSTAEKAYVIK